MKRILFLIGSACWMLFAFGFAVLFINSISNPEPESAILYAVLSSDGFLVGLIHEIGFCVAAVFCLAIAAGLWAHGMVPGGKSEKSE
jgi:hypothetical protein